MSKFFCCGLLVAVVALVACSQQGEQSRSPPYPPSAVIEGISWDFDNVIHKATGSDLWPNTWAADDHLYVAWGDGGGFDGTNRIGRVSLGFARIEGGPIDFKATNVNGGVRSEFPPSWDCRSCGKVAGILSVDGTLYAWINFQNNRWPNVDIGLIWSHDLAATWHQASWVFRHGHGNFRPGTFLNAGRDYTGRRDAFVYFYGAKQGENTNTYLGRAPKERLKDRLSYEFFSGLGADGHPRWSSDVRRIQPVFSDRNGTTGADVIYNTTLERYILTVNGGKAGQLGIFDAPNPWGPWTTVAYYDNWLGANSVRGGEGLVYSFVSKWNSEDGLTMWMIFSCYDCASRYHDRFNLIKATLTLRNERV